MEKRQQSNVRPFVVAPSISSDKSDIFDMGDGDRDETTLPDIFSKESLLSLDGNPDGNGKESTTSITSMIEKAEGESVFLLKLEKSLAQPKEEDNMFLSAPPSSRDVGITTAYFGQRS